RHSVREHNVTRTYRSSESCAACNPTSAGCQLSVILLTGVLMVIPFVFSAYPLAAQTNGTTNAKKQVPKQHFACNVGYTPRQCQDARRMVRKGPERFPEVGLGDWTWVLVLAQDWNHLLSERRFDPNNPAFSFLPKRETFVDGALVLKPPIRGVELSVIWHMP